jgi:hypothetical protein
MGLNDFVWFSTILYNKVENSLKSGKICGTRSTVSKNILYLALP